MDEWTDTPKKELVQDVRSEVLRATPVLRGLDLLSFFDMPWPLKNAYAINKDLRIEDEGVEKRFNEVIKERRQSGWREFSYKESIRLKWNAQNPKLGTWWGMDLNASELSFGFMPTFLVEDPRATTVRARAEWRGTVEIIHYVRIKDERMAPPGARIEKFGERVYASDQRGLAEVRDEKTVGRAGSSELFRDALTVDLAHELDSYDEGTLRNDAVAILPRGTVKVVTTVYSA